MKNYFNHLIRAYTLPMSITPFLVALACAFNAPLFIDFNFILNAFLAFLGIILTHASANLFDDLFDIQRKFDLGLKLNEINFKNKRKACAILSGACSVKQAWLILFVMLFIAFLCGLYFIYLRGPLTAVLIILAFSLSIFYPLSTKYGLSELIVMVLFGPILVNGTYFAITGYTNYAVNELSCAVGIITTVLLITHSLMDYEYDIETKKLTIPTLLKNKMNTIYLILFLIVISYMTVVHTSGYFAGIGKIFFIPVLITLPLALKLFSSLIEYINIKDVKFEPKWYFGPMENWKEIENSGLSYFMFRFYLARNIAMIFNLALAFVCFVGFQPAYDFMRNILFWEF